MPKKHEINNNIYNLFTVIMFSKIFSRDIWELFNLNNVFIILIFIVINKFYVIMTYK